MIRIVPKLAPEIAELQSGQFFTLVGILSLAAVGASLVTLPPLVYAILGLHQPTACAIGAATWAGVLSVICCTATFFLANSTPPLGLLIAVTLMNLAFVGLVSLGLLLVRRRGYRLRWRFSRLPVPSETPLDSR